MAGIPAAATATAGTGIAAAPPIATPTTHAEGKRNKFSLGRLWAFARREAIELQHDRVRLGFAIAGPLLLMIVFGYGISLDVEHLPFAVMDSDDTAASRYYVDSFRGSDSNGTWREAANRK
jgi:ribosome-dependent ATPase